MMVLKLLAAFCLLLLPLDFVGVQGSGPTAAFGSNFEVTPIVQMTTDADENTLRFPHTLFVDKTAGETYLVTGGKSQVIIYSRDFYPLISFGFGRGIYRPQGIFVDHNGTIYLCQAVDQYGPNRITIFNGAFIMVREIILDDNIPGVSAFPPRRIAVNREGIIYVTSRNQRRVLVLDNDGKFLRWLRPEDTIEYRWDLDKLAKERAESEDTNEPTAEQSALNDTGGDIPEEFRPENRGENGAWDESEIGPVMILSVDIDKAGRLYLLSDETNKIYVYSPDETFLFSFGEKGGGPRLLSSPRGLAIDDDRRMIYVVDYMRHTILVYDQDTGKHLFEFGGKGYAPGWYNNPVSIAANQAGQVIVADLFNHRVQVLEVEYERDSPLAEQPEQSALPPTTASDLIEEGSPDADLSQPQNDTNQDETIDDESALVKPVDIIDNEVIFEEEVIEKTPLGKLPAGQIDKEPLDTPSEDRKD